MTLHRVRITAVALIVAIACPFLPTPPASAAEPMRCPVPASTFVSSWGAPRSGHTHQGVDMMAPDGTPIYAVESGTYRTHGNDSFYLDGESGTTYFGTHLQGHARGDGPVVAGELVAYVGHTGNASADAPHLHFEIHPGGGAAVDPYPATSAACSGPAPEVVAAVRYVAEVGAPPTYPYTRIEVQRWYNRTHNPNIGFYKAKRLAAYMNAVVEVKLGQYLLAVYLSRVSSPQTCSGGADCAALIRSVFSARGLDGNAAVRVATCESGLNPRASNGGSFLGLFQQAARYWGGRSAQYGMAGRSAFDPYANAVVSAGMVAGSGWSHWSCRP